ncbi:hypothetical protein WM15_02325 [Burkholderia ubonensis]|nr:hypothetical protein WM15_02325 [Burkholderia ubonensis]
MEAGQEVEVRWNGRMVYQSAARTVGQPGLMKFTVPRTMVIDAIGRTVPVTFAVKRSATASPDISGALDLVIEPQGLVLPVPAVNLDQRDITVDFPGMVQGHTISVQWEVGEQVERTPLEIVSNPGPTVFAIPEGWITANHGKTALVNYAVGDTTGARYMFSRVTRVQIP